MGARTTQAYQMLAVGAACAGLASHEAVRTLTLSFTDQVGGYLQRPRRLLAFKPGLRNRIVVGDEVKRL